jgi:hypothetical protein
VPFSFKKQSQESEKYLLTFLSKINLELTTSLSNLSSRNQQQQDQDLDYLLQDETTENDPKSQESLEIQQHPEQKQLSTTSFTFKEEPNKSTVKLNRSNSITKIFEKSPIKINNEKPKTQQIVTIEKIHEPSSTAGATTTHSVTAH